MIPQKFNLFQSALRAVCDIAEPRVILRGDDGLFWVVGVEEGDRLVSERLFQRVKA